MRFLVLLLAIKLFAVNIVSVNKNIATIDKKIFGGVSGLVVCPYEGRNIIAAGAVSLGGDKIKLLTYDYLKNDAFALPIVYINDKCKVVFGKDYDRVLILAPNQKVYLKLKSIYKNNVIIPSDTFALFVDDEVEKEDILRFSKMMNVGRIIIATDSIYEVDAKTLKVLDEKGYVGVDKSQFFTNYGIFKIDYKKLIKGIDG